MNLPLVALTALNVLALANCGSARATYMPTAGNGPLPPTTQVNYYLDRLPNAPYEPIGIIQVTSPAGTNLNRIVRTAWEKAKKVGCDLIVDRAIYQPPAPPPAVGPGPSARLPGRRGPLCQYAPYPVYSRPVYTPVAAAPPPGQREFICGLWLGRRP